MIQRKQSVFLILAAVISGVSTWIAQLWKEMDGEWVKPEDNITVGVLFLISTFLSLFALFVFKNRKLQIQLTFMNIILNFLLIGYLIYGLTNLPGEFNDSEKGIGLLTPFAVIAMLMLANHFIRKDEKLVKSVDRFR
ncbi:MAG: DUF4293 domain-containing protein [Weeksellaceae bacterium]|jgi:peptidoglycan/LPS O-acetylase OafA/YrhL|nr:DUF4293 domain-containing protein [Weeksellaceae bacterium]